VRPHLPGPPSSRHAPPSARTETGTLRSDDVAHLHRRVAELQSDLHDAEARIAKANAESAAADEMVGQMLARIGEVEAKLSLAQKELADANVRADAAEARAADLGAQLGRIRMEQGKLLERVHAAESQLDDERTAATRLRAEFEALQRSASASAGEEARAEVESLRARLKREQEERESLRMRVAEFATVCQERDTAVERLEALEGEDVGALRAERDALASELSNARAAIEGAAELLATAHGLLERAGTDGRAAAPEPPKPSRPLTMGPQAAPNPGLLRSPKAGADEAESRERLSDDDPTEVFKFSPRLLLRKE
jgi:chromosome segregation ATPase